MPTVGFKVLKSHTRPDGTRVIDKMVPMYVSVPR